MRLAHAGMLLLSAVTLYACTSPSTPAPAPASQVSESRPGTLVITSPLRAAFIDQTGADDLVQITGSGASKGLTIDGNGADVAADGSFTAKVHAVPGMNVVVALDGASRLETTFLWGHFVSPTVPVQHAVAFDLGSRGISGVAPDASIESVANLALSNRDLLASLRGQSFSGEMSAADWKFDVTNGTVGSATVNFGSAPQGVNINATIKDVLVEGSLSVTSLGITYTHAVRVTVGTGNVTGDLNLAVDASQGAITAAMPNAAATLTDFAFDTDNAGFPCCVDSILDYFVQPKIQDAIGEGIRTKVPEMVQLSLDGMGVPKQIDFSKAGFTLDIPMSTRFDGGQFDRDGATITASTFFGGPPKPGTPGATAPGWLKLGQDWGGVVTRAPVLGFSVSIDAVNQLMYAAWSSGSIAYDAPAPLSAKVTAALPPIVSIVQDGVLRVGLGELLVQRATADHPLAAATVMQDVAVSGTGDSLVLTPQGSPTISVTWLDDDSAGSGLNLVADAAKSQLGKYLTPFAFPLPKLPLDKLGGGLAGQSLSVESPQILIDSKTGRIGASGVLKLTK